jgi:hypothetical protein
MVQVFALIMGLLLPYAGFSQTCLPEGITFTTQAQIDSFQINYPNCTVIEGDVIIEDDAGGSNINNINGLSVISSIGGSLHIYHNYHLTNLNGMEGVTSIGGGLWIGYCQTLTNLNGLNNLTSIGENLSITYLTLLNNLTGLENLTSIGGTIWIFQNPTLTSLTGLENIDSESISNLSIKWNTSLSTCAVQSICDYLASPGGTIEINNNAIGCNSQEEIDSACVYLSDNEIHHKPAFSIYPNPSSTAITISTPTMPEKNTTLTMIDITGKEVLKFEKMQKQNVIDISGLPQGVYIVRVSNERTVQVTKFIKGPK